MLPDKVLSTTTYSDDFIPPRNRIKEPLVDYSLGGAGIQDPSEGLALYRWRGRYTGGSIVLEVPGIVAPETVLTVSGVTEFQFTFDQNMQPFVAYMRNGASAHYYWFDPTEDDFVTVDLPDGSFSVRCALDDAREAAGTLAAASDIILTYLRSGKLYFRAQSDRFGTEYLLKSTGLDSYEIGQFGMNRLLRMQWQMVPAIKNPKPSVTSISPTTGDVGGAAFTLTVNGANFTRQSIVRWDGESRTTDFSSSTELTADIPASDLKATGAVEVTVFNPPPGGGESAAKTFSVVGNPKPTLVSIDPTSATAGDDGFTLTVTGTGFVDGESVVRWNGNDRTTTFVSETELQAAILDTDIAEAGSAGVTVFNGTPGGGESDAATFTINEAAATDPNFTSVVLLMHFDGEDAGTEFIDSSSYARELTAHADAALDTVEKKFGTASGLFDGTGDYVSAADAAELAFADSDWTLEGWVRFADVGAFNQRMLTQWGGSGNRAWLIGLNSAGQLEFVYTTNGSSNTFTTGAWNPSEDTWYHFAACRDGNTLRLFVNGVVVATRNVGTASLFNSSSPLTIGGQSGAEFLNGRLDDIRLTVGVARYTADFTPPDAPFPDSAPSPDS